MKSSRKICSSEIKIEKHLPLIYCVDVLKFNIFILILIKINC